MTVAELIAELLKFDQTLPATIASYEFGFELIEEVATVAVERADKPPFIPADESSNVTRKSIVCIGPKDPSLQRSDTEHASLA
jgi:hypothetical protein